MAHQATSTLAAVNMWFLNTQTLELECFTSLLSPVSGESLRYAILSHRWGVEEVLFEDARHGADQLRACRKQGLAKVLRSAEVARQNGYAYIWIDSCCIDKSSSAELSEAINSMFEWYGRSAVYYAFLADYKAGKGSLGASDWFRRGWTL